VLVNGSYRILKGNFHSSLIVKNLEDISLEFNKVQQGYYFIRVNIGCFDNKYGIIQE